MAASSQRYVKIWVILVVLLVVSVIGPMFEIQVLTLITAFGIALVKAYLVAKEFMHIPLDSKYVTYLLVTALAFMLLLFAGTAPDVMNHEGQNWTNDAAKAEVQRGLAKMKAEGDGHH
jgi:caa(3)-type oxidase subunit IV